VLSNLDQSFAGSGNIWFSFNLSGGVKVAQPLFLVGSYHSKCGGFLQDGCLGELFFCNSVGIVPDFPRLGWLFL